MKINMLHAGGYRTSLNSVLINIAMREVFNHG